MKQIKSWAVVFTLSLLISGLSAETKRYEVKSGIIEYTHSGGGNMMGIETKIDGNAKMVFNAWGNVELHDETENSLVMGQTNHSRQTTKIDNGKVYVVDYEKKIIVQYEPEMLVQSDYKDLAQNPKELMLAMGGKKISEETLQGYDCEVWEMMQVKVWLHKGIMLKSEAKVMGITHTTVATKIKLDVPVSDEDLKLPDFPIKPMQEMMQKNNGNTPSQMPQMTPEQMQQMQEMMKSFSQK